MCSSMETMPLQENGSSWWGCLCGVCFPRKKSSGQEFFVPAGTHLGVKLLTSPYHLGLSQRQWVPIWLLFVIDMGSYKYINYMFNVLYFTKPFDGINQRRNVV